jgi:hypothetical protein
MGALRQPRLWVVQARDGSKADIALGPRHVRFTPETGHGGAPQSQQLNQGHNRSGARSLFDRIDDAKIL